MTDDPPEWERAIDLDFQNSNTPGFPRLVDSINACYRRWRRRIVAVTVLAVVVMVGATWRIVATGDESFLLITLAGISGPAAACWILRSSLPKHKRRVAFARHYMRAIDRWQQPRPILSFCDSTHFFWLRICGYGIYVSDRQSVPALFSERNGLKRTLYFGNYRIQWLKP